MVGHPNEDWVSQLKFNMHQDIFQVTYHMYEKSNQREVTEQRDKWDIPSSQAEINFILFNNLQ